MIFIDTNVFVAMVGRVDADANRGQQIAALDLLARMTEPSVAASTSEGVIIETARMLRSSLGGGLSTEVTADRLRAIINLPGLWLSPKHIYLRALDIWADRPGLGFVDALTLAYVEQGDIELASFDRQLLRSPGVTPYWPATDDPL